MKHLGIEVPVKNIPQLDPEFIPIGLFNKAFLQSARKPVAFESCLSQEGRNCLFLWFVQRLAFLMM